MRKALKLHRKADVTMLKEGETMPSVRKNKKRTVPAVLLGLLLLGLLCLFPLRSHAQVWENAAVSANAHVDSGGRAGVALPANTAVNAAANALSSPYSLRIACLDGEKPLAGASFLLYRVGEADSPLRLAAPYSDYGVITQDTPWESLQDKAELLGSYIQRDKLAALEEQKSDGKGQLSFQGGESGLQRGLYLIIGKRFTSGAYTYTARPFFAVVPGTEGERSPLVYPKWKRDRQPTGDRDRPSYSYLTLTAVKRWKGTEPPGGFPSVTVQLLRDGDVYRERVLSPANGWKVRFSGLREDYEWRIVEKSVPSGYTLLTEQEGNSVLLINERREEPPKPDKAWPPEGPVTTPGGGKLPQTGLLWWPIAALGALGCLLYIFGLLLRREYPKERGAACGADSAAVQDTGSETERGAGSEARGKAACGADSPAEGRAERRTERKIECRTERRTTQSLCRRGLSLVLMLLGTGTLLWGCFLWGRNIEEAWQAGQNAALALAALEHSDNGAVYDAAEAPEELYAAGEDNAVGAQGVRPESSRTGEGGDFSAAAKAAAALRAEADRFSGEAAGADAELKALLFRHPETARALRTAGGRTYLGILNIPALSLTLPIQSGLSYPNLRVSPCVYVGELYKRNLVIAGHNYKKHFGELYRLREGDKLSFTDASGVVLDYEVMQVETLLGTDVERMETGDWDLSLFTCTPGGLKRVTVRCRLLEAPGTT